MGNQPSQNQQFNPNFNMAQYNQKLNQIRSQYNHNQIEAPGAFNTYSNRPQTQSMSCQQITRNVFIYKTSIQITPNNNSNLVISFQYHSPNPAILDIAVGVSRIDHDQQTNQITHIECLKSSKQNLPPASQKGKFHKQYPISPQQLKQSFTLGIMMRITSNNEASQYSLSYMQSSKLWRVCLQNFKRNNQVFGIQDIYGGGQQGQQCIICFSQQSNTMVKPCNHLCLCNQCAKVVQKQSNNCPICRKKIVSLVTLKKSQ